MYIAMNRFNVARGHEDAFQRRWLEREVYLTTLPGFVSFQFLRGETKESGTLYAANTFWQTYDDFIHWTQSDQFRKAHKRADEGQKMMVGAPVFEGFEVLQNVES